MKIPWKLSLLQAKKLSFKKTIETQGLLLVFLHLKESSGAFSHANGDYWSNYSVMKIKVRFEKKRVSHASSSTKYKMEFLQWSQIFHIFFFWKKLPSDVKDDPVCPTFLTLQKDIVYENDKICLIWIFHAKNNALKEYFIFGAKIQILLLCKW